MAPSLTETLLALGLGDRVVGVTRYCPEVPGAASVGGHLDPSVEGIVAHDPDLVMLMQAHDHLRGRLEGLGLDTFQVDQHDVAAILASIEEIAGRCGVSERGRRLVVELESELAEVAAAVEGRDRPRVLVAVGREPGTGRITSLWAAGPHTFFDDVVDLAGGVNALPGSAVRYPELSREGLLGVDADVILDVVADGGPRELDSAAIAADWRPLEELRAVRDGRVHVLTDSHVVIPGPRIVDTVRTVAGCLHPGIEIP
jgi:iron complex transport system substrate-binding protein